MSPIRTVRTPCDRSPPAADGVVQQWTRLIRFVAAETAQVHIGEPVDPKLDGALYLQSPRQQRS